MARYTTKAWRLRRASHARRRADNMPQRAAPRARGTLASCRSAPRNVQPTYRGVRFGGRNVPTLQGQVSAAVPPLRGAGGPIVKSLLLLSVSVQPDPLRAAAVVFESTAVGMPSKQSATP
jgi:hypothetical protein